MSKTRIIGIDPGTTESGVCFTNLDYSIHSASKYNNNDVIRDLKDPHIIERTLYVVVESIQSYGMVMGKSTIETCYQIGRIIQVCKDNNMPCYLIPRPEYGKAICGSNKVKDPLIRSALENRFGSYDIGRKQIRLKNGTIKQEYRPDGPLCQLKGCSDIRSAYALCCYALDTINRDIGGLDVRLA